MGYRFNPFTGTLDVDTRQSLTDLDSLYVNVTGDTMTGDLVMSGANIDLGTNYLVGEGGSSGVYVDASGNVGIGTTSPVAKLDIDSDTFRLRTSKTPASASDTGTQGQIAWDSNYLYVCTATDTWKRTALATW